MTLLIKFSRILIGTFKNPTKGINTREILILIKKGKNMEKGHKIAKILPGSIGEELELEVVRYINNNKITVCFIENIDPVGVHTGDSFCSAPMLTISEDVQKELPYVLLSQVILRIILQRAPHKLFIHHNIKHLQNNNSPHQQHLTFVRI